MDRDDLFQVAESCVGPPPESVLIATEEKANNFYTFWRDSEGKIWYTSARTEAFEAEMQEVIRRRKAEKRKNLRCDFAGSTGGVCYAKSINKQSQ